MLFELSHWRSAVSMAHGLNSGEFRRRVVYIQMGAGFIGTDSEYHEICLVMND